MRKIFGWVYALVVTILAIATIAEDQYGVSVYSQTWFACLLALFTVAGATLAVKERVWENVPRLAMTASVGVILLGGLLTYTTAEKGYMHIRKGETNNNFEQEDGMVRALPFVIALDSFATRYHLGTNAPADYVSYVRINGKDEIVCMNKNLQVEGYRFCQASFDDDNQGSWLSVNHDPWGVATTFAGYVLFGLSCLITLLWPNGRFRTLLKELQKHNAGSAFGILLLLSIPQFAKAETANKQVPVISKEEAFALQRQQVVYRDRVVPFNTVARDFVKKLYGDASYHGLMPEQVVGGWSIAPQQWKDEKIIKVKDKQLRSLLGIEGKYCSLADLFTTDGSYRLEKLWKGGNAKQDKALTELDEKVGIILMLTNNTLFKPLPQEEQHLKEAKVTAELFYNKVPFSKVLFMVNITLGILAFGGFVYSSLKRDKNILILALPYLLLLALLFHTVGYALRWFIAGRIPLNNGYETMEFLALCIMAVALVLQNRFKFVLAFGFLLSGFVLLVAYLGEMNPQITSVIPVLNSKWLSTHVSLIMMSYALFAFTFLNSILALVFIHKGREAQVKQLTLLNKILVYPSVGLLGIGITLGAVWANESWGMYWGWDPKEVWALITLMVYGATIVFPDSSLFKKHYHWYMVAAFATVLMTYFGVNYLLGGMHSYGK